MNVYTNVTIEQRQKKLASLEEGVDLETAVAKLIDQATRSNVQRFKHAIKIKVKMPFKLMFGVDLSMSLFCCADNNWKLCQKQITTWHLL